MVTAAYLTSRGGRETNEDAVKISRDGERFCAIVADGLGGHGGGRTASRAAVETILSEFKSSGLKDRQQMYEAIRKADEEIKRMQTAGCIMKTTVVVLALNGRCARWGHVGDSRLYHFQDRRLIFQTMDQSVSQMAVLMGEITPGEIRFHEDRNRVLRAVGGESWEPDLASEISVEKGEHAFLLCSDGFWEYVYEKEMEECLGRASSPQEWLAGMESILKSRAKSGNDNYTAAAVFTAREG